MILRPQIGQDSLPAPYFTPGISTYTRVSYVGPNQSARFKIGSTYTITVELERTAPLCRAGVGMDFSDSICFVADAILWKKAVAAFIVSVVYTGCLAQSYLLVEELWQRGV